MDQLIKRVVVFIPTLNEAAHIETTLRTIIGDPSTCDFDVVVSDGGSDDGTQDIVSGLIEIYPKLQLRHNPKKLQAAALNQALDAEWDQHDILIRCDAHAGYPEDFVTDLVKSLETSGANSVVIAMDTQANASSSFAQSVAWASNTLLGTGGADHRMGTTSKFIDHGHHAAFEFETFRELGGYDDTMPANEDAELDRRLTTAGGKIWFDADIRIIYYPRDTPRKLWKQYFKYGEGRAVTCLRHKVIPKLRQMLPVANLTAQMVCIALGLFVTSWAFLVPMAYLAVLMVLSASVVWSNKDLRGIFSGPAVFIMHMSWAFGFLYRATQDLIIDRPQD